MAGDRVGSERFAAPPTAVPNRPVTVTPCRNGKRIAVADDQRILDAIEAAGVPVPCGCRSGNCGACQVRVGQGQPKHRDTALNDAEREEGKLMCIRVSRATSPELTLDL